MYWIKMLTRLKTSKVGNIRYKYRRKYLLTAQQYK